MRRDSYLSVAVPLLALAATMAAIARFGLAPPPAPAPIPTPPPAPIAKARPKRPRPIPAPPRPHSTPARPTVDEAAIRRAEGELEAAAALSERAIHRAQEAAEGLQAAQSEAASAAEAHRVLAATPSPADEALRVAHDRGERIRAERDRIGAELLALNASPRPRRKPLIDKSPVAKRSDGEEFHFEVRGDRVAFIDLDRLLDRVKTDARVQLRLSNGLRPATGTVGPIGAFGMAYEVSRIDDGENPRMGNFGLTGWEIVPARNDRGETYAAAMGPASDFARAIRRLDAGHDIITLWVYPSGFATYRQFRDTLHAQGFLVAARPLPEGVSIRGSPSGSASSAQ